MKHFVLILGFLLGANGLSAQQKPPSVYGGEAALRSFIHQEMVYPKEALANGIEGTVVLLFVVNADGSTKNMKVWQTADSLLDAETIRLFERIEWNPALWENVPYPAEHFFRVKYDIRKYKKICKRRGYNSIAFPMTPADSTASLYSLEEVDDSPAIVFLDTSMTWAKYIQKNLRYPPEAFKRDIEGTTIISFIVEPHGRLTNFDVVRDLGGGCSHEAIRLLREMDFSPGIKDGMAVRTEIEFAIHFVLPGREVPKNQGTLHQ